MPARFKANAEEINNKSQWDPFADVTDFRKALEELKAGTCL